MGFLDQYDKAPENRKHELAMGWVDSEPLPFFGELRARRPILCDPVCTYVALYEDIAEVLSQPDIFTVGLYEPSMGDYMLAQDDTAIHWREKGIMQSMLNWNDLGGVRKSVGEQAGKILAASPGQLDLVPNYSRMVPALIVQDYFGLNGGAPEDLMRWSHWNQYESFHNQPFDLHSEAERQEIHRNFVQAKKEMGEYLQQLIPRRIVELRMGSKADDITARMLRTLYPESVDFPIPRLALNAGGLLIGTVETTAQAVVQVLQYLLRNPDILARARALLAKDPSPEFDGYVWEALRFDPITPYLFRITSEEYTLAKGTSRATTLPKGTMVLPLIMSAMFDPHYVPDPERFIPNRPPSSYFHLGWGLHECLGKYVALEMVPEMVRQLLLLPDLRAESAIEYGGTPFPTSYKVAWG